MSLIGMTAVSLINVVKILIAVVFLMNVYSLFSRLSMRFGHWVAIVWKNLIGLSRGFGLEVGNLSDSSTRNQN